VEEITAVYKLMVLVPYHHAGLDAKTRAKHQDMFFNGDGGCCCCNYCLQIELINQMYVL
jgi:hypothetical protein